MSYCAPKSTPLALARLRGRVERRAAEHKAAAKKEPEEARGTMMTQIDCPACDTVFDLEGDCDGELVPCPDCNSPLIIRRH